MCGKPNLFDDHLHIMATVHCLDDVRELIKQGEVTRLEERVKVWMKKVQEVYYLMLSLSAFFTLFHVLYLFYLNNFLTVCRWFA